MAETATEELLGTDCKSYYNTGTHAAPSWVLISRIIDLDVNISKNAGTFASRLSSWEMQKGAKKTAEITFGYEYTAGTDTVFDALRAAFIAGTAIEFAFMDDEIAVSGAEGFRAFCEIFEMSETQPLQDGVVVNFTLRPTRTMESGVLVEPDWYAVTT